MEISKSNLLPYYNGLVNLTPTINITKPDYHRFLFGQCGLEHKPNVESGTVPWI